MSDISIARLKKLAKNLSKFLPAHLIEHKSPAALSACQELIAKTSGYPSWHAASQKLSTEDETAPRKASVTADGLGRDGEPVAEDHGYWIPFDDEEDRIEDQSLSESLKDYLEHVEYRTKPSDYLVYKLMDWNSDFVSNAFETVPDTFHDMEACMEIFGIEEFSGKEHVMAQLGDDWNAIWKKWDELCVLCSKEAEDEKFNGVTAGSLTAAILSGRPNGMSSKLEKVVYEGNFPELPGKGWYLDGFFPRSVKCFDEDVELCPGYVAITIAKFGEPMKMCIVKGLSN